MQFKQIRFNSVYQEYSAANRRPYRHHQESLRLTPRYVQSDWRMHLERADHCYPPLYWRFEGAQLHH